jgi:hypothetical protein
MDYEVIAEERLNDLERDIKKLDFSASVDVSKEEENIMNKNLIEYYENIINELFDDVVLPFMLDVPESVSLNKINLKCNFTYFMMNNISGIRYLYLLDSIYNKFNINY